MKKIHWVVIGLAAAALVAAVPLWTQAKDAPGAGGCCGVMAAGHHSSATPKADGNDANKPAGCQCGGDANKACTCKKDANSACGCKAAATQPAAAYANTRCPIMGSAIDPAKVTPALTREYKGQKVAFCCGGCPAAWDKLTDDQKDAKLKAAQAAK